MHEQPNPALIRRRGVIAMLDALGTKGAWARGNPQEFVQRWQHLLGLFRSWASLAETDEQYREVCRECRVFAFSDTVIVTLESAQHDPGTSNYREELKLLCSTILPTFVQAFLDGIFFRGVIAAGEFYQTNDGVDGPERDRDILTIGPVIDEAAEWHNRSDWIGISLVPSASFHVDRQHMLGSDFSKLLVRHQVPHKTAGALNTWALNWPKQVIELSDRSAEVRSAVMDVFSRHPIPPEALSKYVHTLSFLDHAIPPES